MYVCILDAEGQVLVHKSLRSSPEEFLETVAPYREGLVVAVECIFTWYWLADLCAREGRSLARLSSSSRQSAWHSPEPGDKGSSRSRVMRRPARGHG